MDYGTPRHPRSPYRTLAVAVAPALHVKTISLVLCRRARWSVGRDEQEMNRGGPRRIRSRLRDITLDRPKPPLPPPGTKVTVATTTRKRRNDPVLPLYRKPFDHIRFDEESIRLTRVNENDIDPCFSLLCAFGVMVHRIMSIIIKVHIIIERNCRNVRRKDIIPRMIDYNFSSHIFDSRFIVC